MTANHVFYVPLIFALGAFVGALLGRRSLVRELAEREAEERALAARRARVADRDAPSES